MRYTRPVLTRADRLAAAILGACSLVIFGLGAARLGFYYDDSGWMQDLGPIDLPGLWTAMGNYYIPGRPLFVLWQYLLLHSVDDPAAQLGALHLIQSVIDALAVAGFFLLLRLLRLPACAALPAAGLFAFWPTHGETHFFATMVGANLLSTLFVILFAMTSLALWGGRGLPWRLLDLLLFAAALFTYDQAALVLLALVALRLGLALGLLPHLPHLGLAACYFAWKLRGESAFRPDLSVVWHNLLVTLAQTLSRPFFHRLASFYDKVTAADWLLAVAVAGTLAWLSVRLLAQPEPPGPPLGPLFALAVSLYVAAYLPVWLWSIAPRHHYMPSVGLFAGATVALAWIFQRLHAPRLRLLLVAGLGSVTCLFAAASRGESRYWEEAFSLKRQLFSELKPDLQGKDVLVLKDFPTFWGPAYFILPQDAGSGARRLFSDNASPSLRLHGDISSVPAPGGLFLNTQTKFHGSENFRYHPRPDSLIARYKSVVNGRLTFEKNPPEEPRYRVSSAPVPREGPFTVSGLVARRQDGRTTLDLTCQASLPPQTHLVALLSHFRSGEFHLWGDLRPQGLEILPVLLGAPGHVTVDLDRFPATDRIRLDFFQASRDFLPVRLGSAEAPVGL